VAAYLGALALVLLLGTVVTRVLIMRHGGTVAMTFGKTDKSDYVIPPFALLYFYLIFAHAFGWPSVARSELVNAEWLQWIGVGLCAAGLLALLASLLSFGSSFRVGIDTERPGALVTTGIFTRTRNPIYVAFALVLIGEFLIFPNWILLLYLIAGVILFHRQVLREERFLAAAYGSEFRAYAARVPRYL
jgi:protein-S-isoprenylcysteine O-methyltransferase Ste14